MSAGYVHLERVDADAVLAAQPGLLQRRRELFGRLLGLRLLGFPTPKFMGFSLFHAWIRQPLSVQVRTVCGHHNQGRAEEMVEAAPADHRFDWRGFRSGSTKLKCS